MVTGLEAAGVALALLPLLANQLDNYATGFEKVRLLRRYRGIFSRYALGIGTQQTIFLNNLERVLEGAVDDEDKIRALINEPQGNLWQDVSLQDSLKAKLGRSYDVFMRNMIALHDLLVTLSKRLGLDISKSFSVVQNTDPEIRPWKLLNKAVYDDLMMSIDKANDTLNTLIEQSTHPRAPRKDAAWTQLLPRFRGMRTHAQSLFKAVVRSGQWGCVCKDNHLVHLKLPPAPLKLNGSLDQGDACTFRVIFSNIAQAGSSAQWTWREVEFKPWKGDETVTVTTLSSSGHKPRLSISRGKEASKRTAPVQSSTTHPRGVSSRHIADICSSLLPSQWLVDQHVLGFLSVDPSVRYLMTAIRSHELRIGNLPLKENLQQTSWCDRLRIATGLACWVAQFHGNWLKPNWDISDVQLALKSDTENPSLDTLYCTWTIAPQPVSMSGDIEKSSASQIRSDILFPLGLALIELSCGEPIEDFHFPYAVSMDYLQAKLHEVCKERGPGYGDAVHSCLFCPPGMASLGFEDPIFEERLLSSVILPLLREVLHFEGRS